MFQSDSRTWKECRPKTRPAGRDATQQRADRAEDRVDGLRRRVDELEVNLEAARDEAQQATETAAALTRDRDRPEGEGAPASAWDGWRGR